MRKAIISGSISGEIPGFELASTMIDTRYGGVRVFTGKGAAEDLVILPRHGADHQIPPHRINYRANSMALKQLGVDRALGIFAVGSLDEDHPPGSITLLDQFLDFTSGRESTFFDGHESGLVHTEVTDPFCRALRARIAGLAARRKIPVVPAGTYVCVNGPRFETAAEVRMFARLGGHVVGMTGVPEIPLARELGIHYAAVAISINWGAGLKGNLQVDIESPKKVLPSLYPLFLEALRSPKLDPCDCESSALVIHPPCVETGLYSDAA